jgi:hypothetical protein
MAQGGNRTGHVDLSPESGYETLKSTVRRNGAKAQASEPGNFADGAPGLRRKTDVAAQDGVDPTGISKAGKVARIG